MMNKKLCTLLIAVTLVGCKVTQPTVVTQKHDSVMIRTEWRVDSVWNDRWHTIKEKGDTVYIHDSVAVERFRYISKSDTLHVIDSVPFAVEIPKYVRQRNGYDRFTSFGFWILVAILGVTIAFKVYKYVK